MLIIAMFTSCQNVQTQHSETQPKPMPEDYRSLSGVLVVPENPRPGQPFWVVGMGQRALSGISTRVLHENDTLLPVRSRHGNGLPFWWADCYDSLPAGVYSTVLFVGDSLVLQHHFEIGQIHEPTTTQIWRTRTSWTPLYEQFYSVWVNALFDHSSEDSSWTSLHALTQNVQQNLLFNSLGFSEDGGPKPLQVVMEPDCADNPFFLRAYFAWKMGLPFGYHLSDRGYQGKAPQTGQWITNESLSTRTNPVARFNAFLRLAMDGVHSGTARTALNNNNTDYYPVALNRESLRPGTAFADPYGHTFVIIAWKPQSEKLPGRLLAGCPTRWHDSRKTFLGGELFVQYPRSGGRARFQSFQTGCCEKQTAFVANQQSAHRQFRFCAFFTRSTENGARQFLRPYGSAY